MMFTNWATIATQHRPGEPASPPNKVPAPFNGPKVFPSYTSIPDPSKPSFTPPADEKSFYSFIQKIKKATDATTNHLDALGVSVEYGVPVENMLPEGNWFPGEGDKTFTERERELSIDNGDAVEVLARRNKEIKLGHMYRFFQTMELITPYYSTEPESSLESLGDGESGPGSVERKTGENAEGGGEKRGGAAEMTQHLGSGLGRNDGGANEKPEKFGMPEKFREELVKNFIEPICWGYGVRVYSPRAPPKVAFQKSRFLVHLTNYVYLTPKLPAEARAGILEGPVMGIQVRHETKFPTAAFMAARQKKKLIASGKLEPAEPGVDGMDIDGDKEKEDEDDEDAMVADDVIGVAREIAATISIAQDRRKGPRTDRPQGKTEKKVRFKAVGKGEKWRDDIFIMTCLHHHVSISHISVSQPYLRFLETGKMPDLEHEFFKSDDGWDKLKIQKTRFWDLLDPKERVEAARAICGVLSWLSRGETTP